MVRANLVGAELTSTSLAAQLATSVPLVPSQRMSQLMFVQCAMWGHLNRIGRGVLRAMSAQGQSLELLNAPHVPPANTRRKKGCVRRVGQEDTPTYRKELRIASIVIMGSGQVRTALSVQFVQQVLLKRPISSATRVRWGDLQGGMVCMSSFIQCVGYYCFRSS